MKKLIALLLALVMVLSLVACGNNDKPNTTEGGKETTGLNEQTKPSENEDNNNKQPVSNEITLENLKKAAESPASDFECVDHGNGDVELLRYLGSSEIVVIPESWNGKQITTISSYVFGVQSNVKAVRIADSVKTVLEFAFSMNTNLELVICGSGVTELGNSAFQGCTSLRELILNDGLVKIGHASIGGCTNLKTISIPESVTDISHMAFYACPEGFVISGKAGSAAETYAGTANITFKAE